MESFLQWLASSPPASWVQALGTPIIGVVAVYVAYQSATTARKKLKFDMFEKRVRVYEDVRAFFKLTDSGALTYQEIQTISGLRAHAKFLFASPAIDDFLNEVTEQSRELIYLQMPRRPNASGDGKILFPDEDPIRAFRRKTMDQYILSTVTDATPPPEDGPEYDWLPAARWIYDHKNRWDTLTLAYLQLNH
ncbi:hypothetical protein [Achromobacter sp. RW408]|uniref:hypothetical protein n=1 Tax=Achromobacter sp. RW408 TaxID=2202897 RepID=UPI0011B6777D|nr:hypothetical protein [Achromobacter sp. RW408]